MKTRDRLIPRDEVLKIVGASPATIYRWMAAGAFPRPINTGPASVRWVDSEVYAWIEARKQARAA